MAEYSDSCHPCQKTTTKTWKKNMQIHAHLLSMVTGIKYYLKPLPSNQTTTKNEMSQKNELDQTSEEWCHWIKDVGLHVEELSALANFQRQHLKSDQKVILLVQCLSCTPAA